MMARERWRFWFRATGWCILCVSTLVAARRLQSFVNTDPQFVLSSERPDALTVEGIVYASRARVVRMFAPDFGRSIFLMPIAERRRRLLGIDWVDDASISRIWPNRVHVRIMERRPVAFVNRASRVALIDGQGVFLDPPPLARFTFPVLGGVTERQSEAERRERVRAMQRMLEELGPLNKDVSEVIAESTENLKIITTVDGRAVELWLGDGNYVKRLKNFLAHYVEIRRRTPGVNIFDLRLDDRITTKEKE